MRLSVRLQDGLLRLAGVVEAARVFGVGLGRRQEVRPGDERRRPRLHPAQRQDVPADLGGDFIQLPPDLDRAGEQRALTRPVEISGRRERDGQTPETPQASAAVMKNGPCKVAIGCSLTR